MFNPKTLHPSPDPFYVRELKKIDHDLRLEWGWDRYLKNCWVVERRIPPERYFLVYESFLTEGGERYLNIPIYDHDNPEVDENGEITGPKMVGWHRYDMAPEWEYMMSVETPTGEFKPFGADTLLEIRKIYAWNRTHLISRKIWEQEEQRRMEAEKAAEHAAVEDITVDGYDEALRAAGKRVVFGQPAGVLN